MSTAGPNSDGAGSDPDLSRLGDGIAVDYQAIGGGRLRLTFYAGADSADLREICTEETVPDFYDRPENERGRVKNRLLDAIDEHCDDVSKEVVRGGYEELCREFEEADVVEDEDLRSPIVNQLLRETECVEMHASDENATITVQLSRVGGPSLSIDFDEVDWTSSDCGDKIRQQYYVAHQELIDVAPEEWETLRDVWNDQIERVVRDEGSEDDETAHELIRRLSNRIKVTEEYDELQNDPKIALYDRENNDRADSEIQEEHGDVDVLWVQAAAISEVLEEIPEATPDDKPNLARRLISNDTLLRGQKTFGKKRLPVWAFDAEWFGGRTLVGGDVTDDGENEDDGDREVSV